jgi:hypothetical protein
MFWTVAFEPARRIATMAISILVAVMLLGLPPAEAQLQPLPRPPLPEPGTYEAWRDGTVTITGITAWDHDPANRAWWREEVERFWAWFDGADIDHQPLWAFIRLGDGHPYEPYEARWVAECMAGRDIVIPYLSAPGSPGGSFMRGPETGPRFLSFAIFAAGAPAERLERVLRHHLQRQNLTSGEIETVVQTYRSMYVFD